MNPIAPPYALTRRQQPRQQAPRACASVFCSTNRRQLLAGRPYLTQSGGVLVLDGVKEPVRLSFSQWLLNRGRGGLAYFTYRPRNGTPVRLRQQIAGRRRGSYLYRGGFANLWPWT